MCRGIEQAQKRSSSSTCTSLLVSLQFQGPPEAAGAEDLYGCRLTWLQGLDEDDKEDEHEHKEEIEDDKGRIWKEHHGCRPSPAPSSFME